MQIPQSLSQENVFQMATEELDTLNSRITAQVPRPALDSQGFCSSEEVSEYLQHIRKIVEDELHNQATELSSLEWLWFLRRVPDFFFSTPGTDKEPPVTTITELFSALSPKRATSSATGLTAPQVKGGEIAYTPNDLTLSKLARFCAVARILEDTHVLLRLAGKGASFGFESSGSISACAWPTHQFDPKKQKLVSDYNKRENRHNLHKVSDDPSGSTGTPIAAYGLDPDGQGRLCILTSYRNEPEAWLPSLTGHNESLIKAKFSLLPLSYERLHRLNADERLNTALWWNEKAALVMALLRCVLQFYLIPRHPELRMMGDCIRQCGYFSMPTSRLTQFLDEVLPEATQMVQLVLPGSELPRSAKDFVQELRSLPEASWPFEVAGVLRSDGWWTAVDVHAATLLLPRLLEFPRKGGEWPNARALHLELETQAVIDNSLWGTDKTLATLRGRDLTRNGRKITDADGIGCLGDTLLLVDCASVISSQEYKAGVLSVVRNVQTTVEEKVIKWARICEDLRQNPKGSNFDFSKFEKIVGVVCTPFPVYVEDETALNEVAPGLPAAATLRELKKWLSASSPIPTFPQR